MYQIPKIFWSWFDLQPRKWDWDACKSRPTPSLPAINKIMVRGNSKCNKLGRENILTVRKLLEFPVHLELLVSQQLWPLGFDFQARLPHKHWPKERPESLRSPFRILSSTGSVDSPKRTKKNPKEAQMTQKEPKRSSTLFQTNIQHTFVTSYIRKSVHKY